MVDDGQSLSKNKASPFGRIFHINKPFQWEQWGPLIIFIQMYGTFSCVPGSFLGIYMDLCWQNVRHHLRRILDTHHLASSNIIKLQNPWGRWPILEGTSTVVYPFYPVMSLQENTGHPWCYGDDELWWITDLMLWRFIVWTLYIPIIWINFLKWTTSFCC